MKKSDFELLGLRIDRLLEVIEIADSLLQLSQDSKDEPQVRQYEHMKSKFMKEFNELLAEHELAVSVAGKNKKQQTISKAA